MMSLDEALAEWRQRCQAWFDYPESKRLAWDAGASFLRDLYAGQPPPPPTPAPPVDGVRVRVAVAVSADAEWNARGRSGQSDHEMAGTSLYSADGPYLKRISFITAFAPLPEKPAEIEGSIEPDPPLT